MSIIETTLIFAGIPLAVILLISGAVYAGGSRRSRRYRPGRPFEFTPVWFLSAPEQLTKAAHARELTGARRAELTAGDDASSATEWSGDKAQPHVIGGASDRW
ncbi:aa3-type cytochrome oxidase subunit CtaJ [Dactylosporangium sp. CA-233914]|uniref:aa3-type cytochrome oxidase subunit CtaJ n=1 Tax=Dactylosporangium sp. CA-233914 TaxID=3239934 RepID=UPI003D8B2FF9